MKKRLASAAWGTLAMSAAGALAALLGALGTWGGLWSFRTGLTLLRYGAYAGLTGGASGLLVAVPLLLGLERRRSIPAVAAFAIGILTALVPWSWMREASLVPPIHDITTDFENPPAFVEVLPLREGANSVEYAGEKVASEQRRAYPHIQPLILGVPRERAFEKALAVARGMGWVIVAADREAGRIEATDTTFWFRFKDDVVIRVRDVDSGARVDVRSVSRVGRSDLGTNARRVSDFLERLDEG